MALPLAALVWSTLALGAGARVFYHPHRAVILSGRVVSCAGSSSCDPTMMVQSPAGQQPVFGLVSGRVIAAGPNFVHLASAHEPVILVYEGASGMQVQVALGQSVGIGQQIGLSERLRFSVFRVDRSGTGSAVLSAIEPSAWLAARGLKVSAKKHPATQWCEQGRKIQTPTQVNKCGLRVPVPASFMLLPVSVTSE